MEYMLIKYLLIAVIVLIVVRVTRQFQRGGFNVREYVLWLMLWLGGAFVILRPETATFVANLVGVGRGTDFMVYIAVIVLFYLVFRILTRQEKMEREITKTIRELAIDRARTPIKKENEKSSTN